jgi:Sulfatase-modifying factor enzyme 1
MNPESAPLSAKAQTRMIQIEAGTYPMGTDLGDRDAQPMHRVALSAFAVDATEVTNAAFAEFLNSAGFGVITDAPAGQVDRRHLHPVSAADLLTTPPERSHLRLDRAGRQRRADRDRRPAFCPREGSRQSPSRGGDVAGRAGLLPMARRATADRGRVGGGGARQRRPTLSVGSRAAASMSIPTSNARSGPKRWVWVGTDVP